MNYISKIAKEMGNQYFFGINNSVINLCNKVFLFMLVLSAIIGIGACSSVERVRNTTDVVVANKKHFTLEALVQAEIERQRVRKLRCHSSFLNPSAISGAALHPNLGQSWVDELLRDCPEYAAFISELVLRRAEAAGVEPLSVSRRSSE